MIWFRRSERADRCEALHENVRKSNAKRLHLVPSLGGAQHAYQNGAWTNQVLLVADFQGKNMNGNQIEFINLIFDNLTKRGVMDTRRRFGCQSTNYETRLSCNLFGHASVEDNLRTANSKTVGQHWVADSVNCTCLGFQAVLQDMNRCCFW
jgi:hypothetical protein